MLIHFSNEHKLKIITQNFNYLINSHYRLDLYMMLYLLLTPAVFFILGSLSILHLDKGQLLFSPSFLRKFSIPGFESFTGKVLALITESKGPRTKSMAPNTVDFLVLLSLTSTVCSGKNRWLFYCLKLLI